MDLRFIVGYSISYVHECILGKRSFSSFFSLQKRDCKGSTDKASAVETRFSANTLYGGPSRSVLRVLDVIGFYGKSLLSVLYIPA